MSKKTKTSSKRPRKTPRHRSVSIEHLEPIDFRTLADDVEDLDDWLVEPLIAAQRQTAIVAQGGVGKSLIMLQIAVALATGEGVLLRPAARPISVVYIDMEMTRSDLAGRLSSMGIDYPNHKRLRKHLHYYQMQKFDTFDTSKGSSQLLGVVKKHDADLVVIDTFARVISGDENDANTVHKFAANAGMPLKALGVAVVRLDHLGKNTSKGARGSSAKRDDVDVVWTMSSVNKPSGGFKFVRGKSRMPWVPDRVDLVQASENPLRYEVAGGTPTKEIMNLVNKLDELQISNSAGRVTAGKAIRGAGFKASTNDLADAIAHRKRRSGQVERQSSWITTGQDVRTGNNDEN